MVSDTGPSFSMVSEYFPALSVEVPLPIEAAMTFAKGTGVLFLSSTVPLNVIFLAANTVDNEQKNNKISIMGNRNICMSGLF